MNQEKANPSQQLATSIVQQVMTGNIPTYAQGISEIGYSEKSVPHLRNSNSFYKALWNQVPFDVIAKIQSKQVKAVFVKRITWGKDSDVDEVKRICADEGWRVLRAWKDDYNEVVTLVAMPNWEYIDKALDKLYRIGGFYSAEKHEHSVTRPLEEESDEELMKRVGQHLDSNTITEGQIVDAEIQNNDSAQPEANNDTSNYSAQ